MTEHARLSPSSAERWINCPGSIRLCEQFFDTDSEASAEGTCAHTIRERCLTQGTNVEDYLGEKLTSGDYTFEVTGDWVGFLQPGIDRIRESPLTWVIEHRVDLGTWLPGQFGTLDTGGYGPDLIVIEDLKFGRSVIVDAANNMQMMLYALGFWDNVARHHTKATRFLLRIDQPRGQGGLGGSEWYTTLDELLKFGEVAAAAARQVDEPDAKLMVTPKGCHFCPALANAACPEADRVVQLLLGLDPENTDLKVKPTMADHNSLSFEQRAHIAKHQSVIQKWVYAVRDSITDDFMAGRPTPGLKVVESAGNREWADNEEAEEFWKSKMPAKEIFNQQLKSPSEMEKIAGTRNWKKAEGLITRGPAKQMLVSESDPRPAVTAAVDLFDDLDADTGSADEIEDLI